MQGFPKSVFITGATGFIGQRLVSSLLKQSYVVRALVRPENAPDQRVDAACEQIPLALGDVDSLAKVAGRSSAVIYCAGSVRGRELSDFATANIRGVQALVDALSQLDDPPPVLLLSSLAASKPDVSDYANSKFQGEEVLKGHSNIGWTVLRPPAVYGPGDKEMLPVLKMARRGFIAHTGPHDQRISLVHVDDLVEAISVWLAAPQKCLHGTFDIDDGTVGGYDWTAIAQAVSDGKFRIMKLPGFLFNGVAKLNLLLSGLFGYSPMLSPGKARELQQPQWISDSSSFTRLTGWKPQRDLKRGAQELFN